MRNMGFEMFELVLWDVYTWLVAEFPFLGGTNRKKIDTRVITKEGFWKLANVDLSRQDEMKEILFL